MVAESVQAFPSLYKRRAQVMVPAAPVDVGVDRADSVIGRGVVVKTAPQCRDHLFPESRCNLQMTV